MNLYHLSFRDNLGPVLTPRQPGGSEITEDGIYTEDLPPRVSFSPTIKQCFFAIYPNISHLLERKKVNNEQYIFMYVYEPVKKNLKKLPDSLVKRKVWDAIITDEVCIIEPVEVKCIGKVRIHNPYYRGNVPEYIFVHPFGDKEKEELFVSPNIEFDFIKLKKQLGTECFSNQPKTFTW